MKPTAITQWEKEWSQSEDFVHGWHLANPTALWVCSFPLSQHFTPGTQGEAVTRPLGSRATASQLGDTWTKGRGFGERHWGEPRPQRGEREWQMRGREKSESLKIYSFEEKNMKQIRRSIMIKRQKCMMVEEPEVRSYYDMCYKECLGKWIFWGKFHWIFSTITGRCETRFL